MSEKIKSLLRNWLTRTRPVVQVNMKSSEEILKQKIRELTRNKSTIEWAPHRFTIPNEMDNVPLAVALAKQFSSVPKPFFDKLVNRHGVILERPDTEGSSSSYKKINYHISARVKPGDRVTVTDVRLPETSQFDLNWNSIEDVERFMKMSEEDKRMVLRRLIIYEDEKIVVLNKPSGLSVQPGADIKVCVDDLFRSLINEELRLVHRLDKQASGALLMAKTKETAAAFRRIFDEACIDPTRMEKIYWGMALGVPESAFGEIFSNIYLCGRYPQERMTSHQHLRSSVTDRGQPAITQWRHLGTYVRKTPKGKRTKVSLLEMRPITGRKHQLRVHLAEQMAMPLLGDSKYGMERLRHNAILPRPLHLHLYQLRIKDYDTVESAFVFNDGLENEPDYSKINEGDGDTKVKDNTKTQSDKSSATVVKSGSNLIITCPIPQHFLRSMQEFPLFLPKRPVFKRSKLRHLLPRKRYNRTVN